MRFGGIRVGALALGLAGLLSAVVVVPGLAATNVVTVTPGNMQGWFFVNDQTDSLATATGSMVSGPASPPLGTGSAHLTLTTATGPAADGQALRLVAYQGTYLRDITALQYSTYRASNDPGNNLAIALQFDIDNDLDSTTIPNNTYQGRLVFEPYQSTPGTVVQNTWQTWSPMAGRWWGSGSGPSRPISNTCPQSSPCTWTKILEDFPNAGIHATFGTVVLKAGSGWPGFNGNVDALTIGTSANTTTYNFEPTIGPPTNKDQCKNGGWQSFNTPAFKNQGDCVSYTNNGR
jgi:hypothetical protein